MSVSVKQRGGQKKTYSSSSSDEEELKKLESAVWKVDKKFYYEKKGTAQANGTLPPSKRESLEEASTFTTDFRTADTTPEYKNFVAKKLTAYLDGIMEDLEGEPKKRQVKHEQPIDDSFQLFSTSSKSYVPNKINYPQPKWKREQGKRRRKQGSESSSSSDSEEEKKKFEAAAVSGDFILGGAKRKSSSQQENTKNGEEDPSSQVTSNQDCLILTHNAPHLDNDSVETIHHTKKKKMKTSKKDNSDLSGNFHDELNVVTSNGNDIVRTSKKKKKKRKREKNLLGDVSQENCERLNDDLVEETSLSENVSNVAEEVQSTMVHSNNAVEHVGSEHSSNCKKKKKRKRKKELDDV